MEGTGTKKELFWNQGLRSGISTRHEEEGDNNSGALWKLKEDGIERKEKEKNIYLTLILYNINDFLVDYLCDYI